MTQQQHDGMKTILVGYDGTLAAERALERARTLARAFGSQVVVVSVAPPVTAPGAGAFGLMPYSTYAAEELAAAPRADEALWQQHRVRVQEFFGSGIPLEFSGVVGSPAEEIVELADRHAADLIVVGTRDPGFVDRLVGGSVSQSVARHAHCDVLIVRPPDD